MITRVFLARNTLEIKCAWAVTNEIHAIEYHYVWPDFVSFGRRETIPCTGLCSIGERGNGGWLKREGNKTE